MIWSSAHQSFDLGSRGVVMGILNVTPDSFSDGGAYETCSRAVEHALDMLSQGASIIDVGGESTRPGAAAVSAEAEIARVLPVVEALHAAAPDCVISVDTSKASVASAVLAAGASIINDVTALRGDTAMAGIVASARAGVVLMHMQGNPRTMQDHPAYSDAVAEVELFFEQRVQAALAAGIALDRIALDPGIGFGKTIDHNLQLLRGLGAFGVEDRPVVIGVSRKTFLAKVTGVKTMEERLWPTVALTALLRERGARILRVHDVAPNVSALQMVEALLGAGQGACPPASERL